VAGSIGSVTNWALPPAEIIDRSHRGRMAAREVASRVRLERSGSEKINSSDYRVGERDAAQMIDYLLCIWVVIYRVQES
jgi:hypothetical protein